MTAERDALAEIERRLDSAAAEVDCFNVYEALAVARAVLAAQPAPSVPREATEAMIEAAIASANRRHHLPTWAEIWRAMWDAAQPDNDQTGDAVGIPASDASANNRSEPSPDPTAAPAQAFDHYAATFNLCTRINRHGQQCELVAGHAEDHRYSRTTTAQSEPQERMGTHWDGCATEGGPRHYDCAFAAIAALRAERDEWKRKYGDANEWGLRNTAAWKDRAERAEERAQELEKQIAYKP